MICSEVVELVTDNKAASVACFIMLTVGYNSFTLLRVRSI